MTDLVYDYISTGVDMIITAAILSAIVVLLRSSVVLSSFQANMQANSDRMNYYKQFNKYDNTIKLCSADVISALTYYRNEIEIVILNTDHTVLFRNDPHNGKFYNKNGNEVSLSTVQITLKANWTYSGHLYEDNKQYNDTDHNDYDATNYEGGTVTGILFNRTS